MGWFDSHEDSYNQIQENHQASWTHEALSGAAAYEAAKAYEDHVAANGKPDSHAKAKEILAGFAGAAVDRLIETKGLDAYDSYEARNRLQQSTVESVNETYTEDVYSNGY